MDTISILAITIEHNSVNLVLGGTVLNLCILSDHGLHFLPSFAIVLYCIVLLLYVHGKHVSSCQDCQLTSPHFPGQA